MVTYSEVVQERKEYLERKSIRFSGFAINAEKSAEDHFKKSNDAVSGIPFGQPILLGHHSQRRHENAIERSNKHSDKAISESKRAENWDHRARHAESLLDRMENSTCYMENKIDESEKLIRLWDRRENLSSVYIKLTNAGKLTDYMQSVCGYHNLEESTKDNERAKIEGNQAKEKLAYWKEKLLSIGGVFDISTLKKGDVVKTQWGNFPVVRINPKTVTIGNWLGSGIKSQFKIPPSQVLEKVI